MDIQNVLLNALESADAMRSPRGFNSGLMPNLNEFASKEATPSSAYATAPWSLRSVFPGKYRSKHRTRTDTVGYEFGQQYSGWCTFSGLYSRQYELPDQLSTFDCGLQAVGARTWDTAQGTDGLTRLYNVSEGMHEVSEVSDRHPAVVDRLTEAKRSPLKPTAADQAATEADVLPPIESQFEDLGGL